jgi:hypothetical protein
MQVGKIKQQNEINYIWQRLKKEPRLKQQTTLKFRFNFQFSFDHKMSSLDSLQSETIIFPSDSFNSIRPVHRLASVMVPNPGMNKRRSRYHVIWVSHCRFFLPISVGA